MGQPNPWTTLAALHPGRRDDMDHGPWNTRVHDVDAVQSTSTEDSIARGHLVLVKSTTTSIAQQLTMADETTVSCNSRVAIK